MKRILLLAFSILSLSVLRSQTAVNLNWMGAIGSTLTTGDDKFERSCMDAAGNIYITGQLSDYTDMDHGPGVSYLYGNYTAFIAKYSPTGALLWKNGLAGSAQSEGLAIGVDASGNVYLTGTFSGGTADMDPTTSNFPLANAGPCDLFLSKYSSTGAFLWAQGVGGSSSFVKPSSIKVDGNGDVYLGGNLNTMSTPLEFNPNGPSFTLTSVTSAPDAFLVKYNSSGLAQWGFSMGDFMADYVYDIETDASNNVYITGDFQISVALNPAQPTNTVASQGLQDGYIAKYSSAGTYLWGKTVGGILGDGFYRIKNNAGNIAVTGYMESTVMDADPDATTFNLNKAGSSSYADVTIGMYSASTGSLMWAKNTGNSDVIHAWDLATDMQNNIYIAGDFTADTDFDMSAAASTSAMATTFGYKDIYFAKYDQNGNFLYVKSTGFSNTDHVIKGITVTNTDDIIIAGMHSYSIDVDFNSTNNLNVFGGADIFVIKYNQCTDASTPTVAVVAQTMCANGVATLSLSGGNLNSATNWVWSGLACGTSTIGVGTTVTVSPLFNTVYYVRGEGGCTTPGPCASASVDVDASNNITGIITTNTAGPVPVVGTVQLFRYEGPLTKWDSVTYQLIGPTGDYLFTAVNSGTYIVMCTPTSTDLVRTYAPSNRTWKNSLIVNHGCAADYTINIDVIPIPTVSPGPGVLAGKITEGVNYGGKGGAVVPGSPIGGLSIKGGKNPGGNIVAQGRTDGSGSYTLSGLPLSGPGETYYVFVDIPGVDTAGTHHRAITTGTTMYTDIDFVVDSDYVHPVDYTGIKEIKLAGELVRVYPNPANDLVNIKLDARNESDITLELYDVFGKKILSENYYAVQNEFKTSIDVGKLNRGVYFVKLKLNSSETTIKLILSE